MSEVPPVNRPVGVTVLATMQAITSGIALLAGLGILIFSQDVASLVADNPELQQSSEQISPELLQGVAIASGIFFILFSLIGLWVAFGLFKLKGWAWLTTLIFQGFSIIGNLSNLANSIGSPGSSVLQLAIAGVIVYYLLRPNVKRAFGKI